MPSLLEDPTTKIPPPVAAQEGARNLQPRKTQTRDNRPITLYPVTRGAASLPAGLVSFLHEEFAKEVQSGTTYPMETPMAVDLFAEYWFGTLAVIAVLDDGDGDAEGSDGLREGRDWERVCLGSFYIKPNYPGSFFPPPPPRGVYNIQTADMCNADLINRPLLACLQRWVLNHSRCERKGSRDRYGRDVFGLCAEAGTLVPQLPLSCMHASKPGTDA